MAALRRALCGLDVEALVAESPSDAIRAWLRPAAGSRMESVSVDEATALALHRSGASLYFRAPQALTDALVPRLSRALGADFSIYYADGALRAETETFCARKGHRTDWHTDFQENFTVQLSGTRKWRFKRQPGPGAPLRGLSRHYSTMEVYEQQMKVCLDANESIEYEPEPSFFEDAEEVILNAGDVLYHPAGIWHAVECESDDAVSINFSLSHQNWADIIGSGVQQALWRELPLRERVEGVRDSGSLRALLADRLQAAKDVVARLTVDDLCPPALALPRVTFIMVQPSPAFRPAPRYRRSATGVLVPLLEECREENSDDEEGSVQYAFHAGFGNTDLESLLRVVVAVPPELRPAVEQLRRLRGAMAPSDLPGEDRNLVKGLVRALHFAGYLVAAAAPARRRTPS